MRCAPVWAAALTGGLLTGCLPGDTRPEPSSLVMYTEPGEAIASGFDTPDGWRVTFDRFVTGIGDVNLEEDSCNTYSETHYERLFDFTKLERERVGIVYGIGECRLEFRMRSPSSDALLGKGVTESDLSFMRTRADDSWSEDNRVALIVKGRAQREDEEKRFEWIFRTGYRLTDCESLDGDGFYTDLHLVSGGALTETIEARGQELFRKEARDEADLHFDAYADADVDADGSITLEELDQVPAPEPEEPVEPESGSDEEPPSLADLVYGSLLPRVTRLVGGGVCDAEQRNGRRR